MALKYDNFRLEKHTQHIWPNLLLATGRSFNALKLVHNEGQNIVFAPLDTHDEAATTLMFRCAIEAITADLNEKKNRPRT